ncbi:SDR family NAD(P)-dependent oxidoreductase [Pelagibacterium luteolum]|uniref:NAD(P)-dependent dehydrogenase, short-chain alcohol dehydrogenase family n=1 Tax=Pelagibacterium luteolum TaxID=440168 RepID=A0A1G7S4Z9_9HYPH|nr:SDR family oxidoreductase [Pelagibacterium luteolum]SDG18058.1 NAD(P)-dependent dehydrogenase, short-chain alcohol dehydrogenase family [Pelagibacterium luteolum]
MGDRFGSLAGKRVLYTGAAGGLGLPTTLKLLDAGAQVVVLDNDPSKVAQLRTAAHEREGLDVVVCDLSDLNGLRKSLDTLTAQGDGFDIVINNAAIYPSKPFEEFTLDEMQLVHRINVEAAIVCVMAALPAMRAKGWGRIVNVSSITVAGAWDNLVPYVQSKMALVGLARGWAREFGVYGITANALAPGAFPTDAEAIHPDREAYEKRIIDSQAIKRRGRPDDIANALMFLCSDASAFITGQTLNVDGGWIMK